MKSKLVVICLTALLTLCVCGCNSNTEDNQPTEPATQATAPPTQAPTQPPTQAPTPAPTEPPTPEPTDPPQVEIGTFSVTIEEIPTQPPTPAPTQPPTLPASSTGDITLIRGAWYLDHYEHANGQATNPTRYITYNFNTNGTFSVDNGGTVSTGTYVFDGKKITYMSDATGEIGDFDYDSELLNLVDSDESGMKAVFDRNN